MVYSGKCWIFVVVLSAVQCSLSLGQVSNPGSFINDVQSPWAADSSRTGQIQSSPLLGNGNIPNYPQNQQSGQFVPIPNQAWSKGSNVQSFSANTPNHNNLDSYYQSQKEQQRATQYHNGYWSTDSKFWPRGNTGGLYDRYYTWNEGMYDPYYSNQRFAGMTGGIPPFMYSPMTLPARPLFPLPIQNNIFGGLSPGLIGTVALGALLLKKFN